MDGRRFRRWWLLGGAVVAVGCTRSTYPTGAPTQMPAPGQAAGAVPAAGTAPLPGMTAPSPGLAAELPPAKPRKPGQGLRPETEVSLAQTHIQVALADPPPPNRDELLDMARVRFGRALKQEPKNKSALLGVARMYARLGDREKALEAYKKYRKAHPKDADGVHDLAVAQARWGDWAAAVAGYEAALKLDPENRTYRKELGFCLARAGRVEEAVAALCQVMPEAQARYGVARALDDMQALDASREQLYLALRADPGYAPAREALADVGPPAAEAEPVRPVAYEARPGR